MLVLKRFVIFSLKGLNSNTDCSAYKSKIEAILKAHSIDFKHVLGSYKNTLESSIVAIVDTDLKLDKVRSLAFQDDQESILIVDESRRAYLEYNEICTLEFKIEPIGNFRHVQVEDIKDFENWTLDGTDYYTCI